jgi:hypothetical protein
MGEYIARIHDEVKGRPLYLVRDAHGLAEQTVEGRRGLLTEV